MLILIIRLTDSKWSCAFTGMLRHLLWKCYRLQRPHPDMLNDIFVLEGSGGVHVKKKP